MQAAVAVAVSRSGRPLEIVIPESALTASSSDPVLIVGLGRGAQVELPQSLASLWVCAQGMAQISGGACLRADQILIHTEARMRISSIGESRWLGLAGSPSGLRRYFGTDPTGKALPLFPSLDQAEPTLAGLAGQILDSIDQGGPTDSAIDTLIGQLAECVEAMQRRIALCPGRCLQTRRTIYQRLLRARNRITADPATVEGIEDLAAMANYSSWHFIRAFRRVFGETPMEYAHRLRLDRACALIEEGQLSVSEIARDAGFETFSAFCRSFRNRYGTTATALRQREHRRALASTTVEFAQSA